MVRHICITLCRLGIGSALTLAALPIFAQTPGAGPASGTNSADWTPANVIALITAIGSAIVAIIGALRGTAAQSKSDANEQRINAVSTRLDAHGQQITDLATNMMPPSMMAQMARPVEPPPGKE